MATRMQQRRGTAEQWTTANPILAAGEIGFETDNSQFKVGDGVTSWDLLSYFQTLQGLGAALDDYVLLAQVGANGGLATLDVNGDVPLTQLGNVDVSGAIATYNLTTTNVNGIANTADLATKTYADNAATTAATAAVSAVIDAAPGTLDTLNELAAALGDDASFATTVTTSLAAKANSADVTSSLLNKKTEISLAVSSNITLEAGYRYFVNTTSARSLTLPASPTLGQEIQIFDSNNSAGTNGITINRNAQNINGVADNALLDVNGVAVVFVYTGSTYGWRMG